MKLLLITLFSVFFLLAMAGGYSASSAVSQQGQDSFKTQTTAKTQVTPQHGHTISHQVQPDLGIDDDADFSQQNFTAAVIIVAFAAAAHFFFYRDIRNTAFVSLRPIFSVKRFILLQNFRI